MSSSDSDNREKKIPAHTRASERAGAQRKKSNRMFRTILLGTMAMVAGVLWLGEQYGIERQETLDLLMASAGFVLLLAATGIAGALFIRIARWLFRGNK